MYWFIPITSIEPLIWSIEREPISNDQAQNLLAFTKKVHPKWVMVVKLDAIVSDEEMDSDACGFGSDDTLQKIYSALRLPKEIVWSNDSDLHLSHCGQAFFDAILSSNEVKSIVDHEAMVSHHHEITNQWVQRTMECNQKGQLVFILREG